MSSVTVVAVMLLIVWDRLSLSPHTCCRKGHSKLIAVLGENHVCIPDESPKIAASLFPSWVFPSRVWPPVS